MGRTTGRIMAAGAVSVMTLALISPAGAERAQSGNLIVSLKGGVTPRKLPRHRPVPVAVRLAGRVLTADVSPIPRVNWIKLELGWRGRLDTLGLPVCSFRRLQFSTSQQVLDRCGPALVGHGRLFAKIFVPKQSPFGVHSKLLAFNGRTKEGGPRVLVHAYTPSPPVAFVIPFSVHHQPGSFRTVLITTIRKSVGPWPRVSNFQIVVSRSFAHRGKRHSYLKASCPVPQRFSAGFLSFARATYSFNDGHQIKVEAVRSCRAR